jgi:hypothetical protein
MPDGGAFVVIESLIDDARRENAFGLMMSLNMLIETGDGFDFTGSDLNGWCRESGSVTSRSFRSRVQPAPASPSDIVSAPPAGTTLRCSAG